MKLIHPTDPATGERVREYVGKDPAKQALAQARLDRWREYINLEHELSKTEGQIASLDRLISGMETAAFGRQ